MIKYFKSHLFYTLITIAGTFSKVACSNNNFHGYSHVHRKASDIYFEKAARNVTHHTSGISNHLRRTPLQEHKFIQIESSRVKKENLNNPASRRSDASVHKRSHADSNGKNQRSFSIDKGTPDLQFGLSFTVPVVSLNTNRLLSDVLGPSYGGWGSGGFGDVSSLFKLNIGGLIVAAILGAAAIVFVPSLLGSNGLWHGGKGFLPNIFNHGLIPGIFDSFLDEDYDPWFGQYSNNYDPYLPSHRTDGKRGKSIDGGRKFINSTDHGSFLNNILQQVKHTVKAYYNKTEPCLLQIMCLRGRRYKKLRSSGHHQQRESEYLEELLNFFENDEHNKKASPAWKRLRNAFYAGNTGSLDCTNYSITGTSSSSQACPVDSSKLNTRIDNLITQLT